MNFKSFEWISKFTGQLNLGGTMSKLGADRRGKIGPYGHIDVYIMTWSEVINNAKVRLKFYQEQLQFEASDDDIRTYLFEKHEEFLPSSYKDNVVNDEHLEPKVVNK